MSKLQYARLGETLSNVTYEIDCLLAKKDQEIRDLKEKLEQLWPKFQYPHQIMVIINPLTHPLTKLKNVNPEKLKSKEIQMVIFRATNVNINLMSK